jgi:hypothetical protein
MAIPDIDDDCDGHLQSSEEDRVDPETCERLQSYCKDLEECRLSQGHKPCYEEWLRKIHMEMGPCAPSTTLDDIYRDSGPSNPTAFNAIGHRPNPVPNFDGQKAREQFEKRNGGPMKWL